MYFILFPLNDVCLDVLPVPVPTLALDRQTDVGHLVCTGSPAYPGAMFSLFLADQKLPIATLHAKVIQHQVIFPVPVQDTLVALYQCQYSVLLAGKWSHSERSIALAVTRGTHQSCSANYNNTQVFLVLLCVSLWHWTKVQGWFKFQLSFPESSLTVYNLRQSWTRDSTFPLHM